MNKKLVLCAVCIACILAANDTPKANKRPIETIQQSQKQAERTIVIKNNISKDMLPYKHLFGTFTPNKFVVKVNQQPIELGTEKTIKIANNALNVSYEYEFASGKRHGIREVDFIVEPEASQLSMTFDWKDKFRIKIDNARALKKDKIKTNKKDKKKRKK